MSTTEAVTADDPVGGRNRLTRKERRALGIGNLFQTLRKARPIAVELSKAGEFEGLTRQEKIALVADEFLAQNSQAAATAAQMYVERVGGKDPEFDWQAFAAAVIAILEVLGPFILLFL